MDAARLYRRTAHLHVSSSAFRADIAPLEGFHLTVSISPYAIPLPKADANSCHLHALALLPPDVFVDPYELQQRRQDGRCPPFRTWGDVDLELPTEAVDQNGTALLLDLSHTSPDVRSIDFPIHLRYPMPLDPNHASEETAERAVDVPWPFVFWACSDASATDPGADILDAVKEPFQSPFSKPTSFRFISPAVAVDDSGASDFQPSFRIKVPAGNAHDLPFVEFGTALAILCAFFYVALAAWRVPSCRRKVD